jgi:DNA-binding CsgD family transcriptional regulator/tetratricopeptide (TPR) repeat protein
VTDAAVGGVSRRGVRDGALIGRAAECGVILDVLGAGQSDPAGVLLEGAAGAGKTTLWRWATAQAAQSGMTVLAATGAELEVSASFAALTDLLAPVADDIIGALPAPQSDALAVALLRSRGSAATETRAVGMATLGVFRALADQAPVVVAVDDVQWIDEDSAAVLAFALRRADPGLMRVLLARRLPGGARMPPARRGAAGRPRSRGVTGRVMAALSAPGNVVRLAVTGLPLGALQEVTTRRLGRPLPRPLLQRIHEATGGNPLFALELAAAASDAGPGAGDPLPVRAELKDLLLGRIDRLSPAARDLVLVASAARRPTLALAERALGSCADAVTEAVRRGVIEVGDDVIGFVHPLYGSAVYAMAGAPRRRRVHRMLAGVVDDAGERARHLALAAPGPDEDVAGEVERAGIRARTRGARAEAADLLELAGSLTPADRLDDWGRRLTQAALCHHEAGSGTAARKLLGEVVAGLPAGRARAEALLAVTEAEPGPVARGLELIAQGMAEAGDDAHLRARLQLARLEHDWAADMAGSVGTADAAVGLAQRSGDAGLHVRAIAMAGITHVVAGLADGLDMLRQAQALQPPDSDSPAWYRPEHWLGTALLWADELDQARSLLVGEYQRAELSGNDYDRCGLALRLAQLECRAGQLAAARDYAQTAASLATEHGGDQATALADMALALIEAVEGRTGRARELLTTALATARRLGDRTSEWRARAILGFAELSQGDPAAADAQMGGLHAELSAARVGEPGESPFVADEIEALVLLGRLADADELCGWLEARGAQLHRPRFLAAGARCRAQIAAAGGALEQAQQSAAVAVEHAAGLGVPLERGRSLLVLGQIERRLKQKSAARTALRQAKDIFDALPAPLWAQRAQAELARIGGRPPASAGKLTATEGRIVELVVAGMSNAEVARTLFISVHTVEANLTRIYVKFSVRSRAQLIARLGQGDLGPR